MGYRYSRSRRRKRRSSRGYSDAGAPGLIEEVAELFVEMMLLCVRSIARSATWVGRKFRGATALGSTSRAAPTGVQASPSTAAAPPVVWRIRPERSKALQRAVDDGRPPDLPYRKATSLLSKGERAFSYPL